MVLRDPPGGCDDAGMPHVEICRWLGTREGADPQRRLLVLPGMNFPISMPLLFMPSVALADAGWTVWHAQWDLSDIAHDDDGLWAAVNTAASDLATAAGASDGGTTVVMAKSVGTLGCRWVAQAGLPAVWLTPLVRKDGVIEYLGSASAPTLLIGGSADRSWDRAAAEGVGGQILEIPGADHALYSSEWRSYLGTLEQVTDTVLDFAGNAIAAST